MIEAEMTFPRLLVCRRPQRGRAGHWPSFPARTRNRPSMREALPVALSTLLVVAFDSSAEAQPPTPEDTELTRHFALRSDLLSSFWGRDMHVEAGVVLPPDVQPDEKLPVVYRIHGFGGSHRSAWRSERRLAAAVEDGSAPRMIHVYLNAQFPLGHHEFADSVNNGPWGAALTTEFIPALEREFPAFGEPEGRFLTGHSSGGWSSLWLQVTYPDFFNGTWSTAPDSIDFRDFTGIDIYSFENAYVDPAGEEIMLMRRGPTFIRSIRQYVERELSRREYGGQFASFNAVFSPRAEDGRPMKLFDPETGVIDRFVAESWKRYDIGLILREQGELRERLAGKLHVFCGELDTFRLEGACRLVKADLETLGSDAEVVLVPERDHGSLFAPHPELWPDGLYARIHREMGERFAEVATAVAR